MEESSREIVHNIPTTEAAVAQQNYGRGRVSAFEELIDLAEEYKEWKESKK